MKKQKVSFVSPSTNQVFLYTINYFSKTKRKNDRNNYSILQEMKIGPKSDICPFCMKAFNYSSFIRCGNWERFYFSRNLSAFESKFQYSCIWALR